MTVPNHDKDIVRLLASTGAPTAAELAELRARLTDRAEEAGLLDVAYRMLDTAVGTLLIAATRAGLVRVAYEREGLDRVLETLAALGIIAGVPVSRLAPDAALDDVLLLAATELTTDADIAALTKELAGACA